MNVRYISKKIYGVVVRALQPASPDCATFALVVTEKAESIRKPQPAQTLENDPFEDM
jgi:hypothetical protein